MTVVPAWGWLVFATSVGALLLVDLLVRRRYRRVTLERAAKWSAMWVASGLLFALFVWYLLGARAAQEYVAAYLIEESLSVDNLFVFLVIFRSLQIPEQHQHRVLFWGIFGAMVFRGLLIVAGVQLLARWEWVSCLLGVLLIALAIRVLRQDPGQGHESWVLTWLQRHLPMTSQLDGHRFITRQNGRRVATPLLVAIIAIEFTDILFAVDSVPATLSVSRTPYVIYSSNMFAVLGLRSLYTVLASGISRLKYLHYGLAAILALAGTKVLVEPWIHVPPWLSIGLMLLIGGLTISKGRK